MTDGPRPIAHAVAAACHPAETRQRISDAWRDAPFWLRAALTRIALNPRATSDAFLIVSDGLEEARREASAAGHLCAARGLERLRDIFAVAAPARADVALVDPPDASARHTAKVLRGLGRRGAHIPCRRRPMPSEEDRE